MSSFTSSIKLLSALPVTCNLGIRLPQNSPSLLCYHLSLASLTLSHPVISSVPLSLNQTTIAALVTVFFYTNPFILCKAFKVNQLRIKSGAFSSVFVILARGLEKQSYPHTFLSGSFIYRTPQRASRVTLIAPRENSFQEEFRLCATNLPL